MGAALSEYLDSFVVVGYVAGDKDAILVACIPDDMACAALNHALADLAGVGGFVRDDDDA